MAQVPVSPPDTGPGFGVVLARMRKLYAAAQPDAKFLKKMKATNGASLLRHVQRVPASRREGRIDMASNATSCDGSTRSTVSGASGDDERDDALLEARANGRCPDCNADVIYIRREASKVCTACGLSFGYQEDSIHSMPRDGFSTSTSYMYKRANHFRDWINRSQAKESTTIDPEVLHAVIKELRKERIRDFSKVDSTKVRRILKKLDLQKYYNHKEQITSLVSGRTPLRMTPVQEQKLLEMFEAIQDPFQKHCPPDRTNMLSYAYLIYKFAELCTYDELLPYFSMLKSRDKIWIQDRVWAKICAENNWEFIRSLA